MDGERLKDKEGDVNEIVARNMGQIQNIIERLLSSIQKNISLCPLHFRYFLSHIKDEAVKYFPDTPISHQVVCAFPFI